MLPNEVFALECIARYAREGLVVDSSNGQFAHCPYPRPKGRRYRLAGDLGYWLTFEDHQKQGLLQSVDFERRCFFTQDVSRWLDTKPPGYKELNVIFKNYISGRHNPMHGQVGELNHRYGQVGAMLGISGELNSCSKAIIVIKPDGTELRFGSIGEAGRELQCSPSNICCRWIKTAPKSGKFEGWLFFYAE